MEHHLKQNLELRSLLNDKKTKLRRTLRAIDSGKILDKLIIDKEKTGSVTWQQISSAMNECGMVFSDPASKQELELKKLLT